MSWFTDLTPTDWIAGYAALVATGTLAWSIIKDRREQRPDVTVSATFTAGMLPPKEGDGNPYGDDPDTVGTYNLTVLGTEPITVTRTGVAPTPDPRGQVAVAAYARPDSRKGSGASGRSPFRALPQSAGAAEALYIHVPGKHVLEAGGDPQRLRHCWIELSNGHRYSTTEPVRWQPPRPHYTDERAARARQRELNSEKGG